MKGGTGGAWTLAQEASPSLPVSGRSRLRLRLQKSRREGEEEQGAAERGGSARRRRGQRGNRRRRTLQEREEGGGTGDGAAEEDPGRDHMQMSMGRAKKGPASDDGH